jgi:hypothetical protein
MNRLVIAAMLASALAGCADQSPRHGAPPQDPPDYHGVPTDDRPPSMLDAPAAPASPQ